MSGDPQTYFGKYRGKVENVLDPMGLGRVQVSVPDVLGGGTLAWAMPCLPGAGPKIGFFAIPPKDALVWVEFERGDPDYPIWVGGFWKKGDTPVAMGPQQAATRAWVGENFKIEILDMKGAAKLKVTLTTPAGDAKIAADAKAMEISFGKNKIKLAIDGVSINGSNLKVLP